MYAQIVHKLYAFITDLTVGGAVTNWSLQRCGKNEDQIE